VSISSRTPEGEWAHCPVCRTKIIVEPSILFGDVVCLKCGRIVWFIQFSNEVKIFEPETKLPVNRRFLNALARRLCVTPDAIEDNPQLLRSLNLDSLDHVELTMEMEEEFD